MWKPIFALTLIAALCPALAGAAGKAAADKAAAEKPPLPVPPLRFEPQLGKIDAKAAKLFGEDKQKALRLMAEAAVLSDYCADINLNQDKFQQEFDAMASDGAKRTWAEQKDYLTKLSMYYGAYVGVLVAEGADRRAEFCGVAEEALKDQRPISRFWIATAREPAAAK